jgi:hypothetical protein
MNSNSIHNALDYINAITGILRQQLPHAHWQLEHQMADGLAAHPTDNDGHARGGHSSPVESTVMRRLPQHTTIRNHHDELDAACKILRNLERETRTILGNTGPAPRCTGGTGRDGNLDWGRPDCTELPGRGSLCIACYHRERRWRNDHGLPTREVA